MSDICYSVRPEMISDEGRAMISVEEFRRIDLRIGEIVAAAPVPKTDRLMAVEVDLGGERRTLVAAIAHQYAPADLLGLKVVVAANLRPARIRGTVSQGMLLGANCHGDERIALLTVSGDVPNGTPVE